MRIVDFRLRRISAELKKPFVTNIRRVDRVEDVLLELIADDGTVGYGEAPPTVAITGEDLDTIERNIKEHIFPAIKGMNLDDEVFVVMHASIPKSTSAKACVDIALHDLLSRSKDVPLYEYLGGKSKILKTNLTISLGSVEDMLQDALAAYDDGFEILKVKVGESEEESVDITRLIREHLPNAVIRLDANQAWDAQKSLRIADKVARYDIELIEQPVKAADFEGLKYVSVNSPVPILADESAFGYEDALRILDDRAAHYINIKLMKTGGIYEAARVAKLARERGAKVMMGSMLESVVSISAAVHFAMSDDNICFYDLDGPLLAKPSSVKNALIFDKDEIKLAESVGLGIEI